MLKRDSILFARDEKGELIPQEVKLVVDEEDEEQVKYKGETICIVPISRGEVKKLFSQIGKKGEDITATDKDLDADIIIKYCITPKLEKKDIEHMKPSYVTMFANTIMFESGLQVNKPKKEALKAKEDEFGKNSEELNQKEKKAI